MSEYVRVPSYAEVLRNMQARTSAYAEDMSLGRPVLVTLHRRRRPIGEVLVGRSTICYSYPILAANWSNDDWIDRIIEHELAHIKAGAHGSGSFESFCADNNIHAGRTIEIPVRFEPWVAICPEHGIVGRWARKPKYMNRACQKCGKKVTILHKEQLV